MRFWVKVVPRSSKAEVLGKEGDVIKVKVTSPPEGGKANKELLEVLSKWLGVKKSKVKIVSGETSRKKLIEVEGLEKLPFS